MELSTSADSPRHGPPGPPGIEQELLAADPKAWKQPWVMDVEAVGDGRGVLKYLAPYVNRVAISDKRIVAVDDTHVTFRMTPSGTRQTITKRVTGTEFVRGFVQHVLPPGFHKIRYYGWQHPRRKIDVEEIRWLACAAVGMFFLLRFVSQETPEPLPALRCDHCGGDMSLVMIILADGRVLGNHRRPFLDSG